MSFFTSLCNCFRRVLRKAAGPVQRRASHRQRPGVRLGLERLEDRTVPTAGGLDPTFGVGGSVFLDLPGGSAQDQAQDLVLVQADAKVLVVGNSNNLFSNKLFSVV